MLLRQNQRALVDNPGDHDITAIVSLSGETIILGRHRDDTIFIMTEDHAEPIYLSCGEGVAFAQLIMEVSTREDR